MQRLVLTASALVSVSALGVALLGRSDPPPAPAPSTVSEADLARLEGRVTALEAELDVLRGQVRAGGGAVVAPGVAASPVAPEALAAQVAQLKQELADLQAGEALAAPSGRDYLKELVKEASRELDRERQQARAQEFVKSQEAAKSQRAERWKRFVSEANLTWQQEQMLNARLAVEESRREELLAKLRDGELGFGEVRRGLGDVRRETDQAMTQTLSPEQRAKYDAARAEEGGFGRGPGGGGGRQRGGDPGQGP